MITRGESFAAGYVFGGVLQAMSVVGAILGGLVADQWLGARYTLMVWCGIGALAALLVAVTNTTITNIAGVAAAGLFIIGGQFVLNNICARTYPVHARGTGEGLMLGFGRLGGILGAYFGGALIGVFGNNSVLFIAFTIAAALAVLSASFVVARPAVVATKAAGEVTPA